MNTKLPCTPGVIEAFALAAAEAGRLGQAAVTPEHFLLGIIRKGNGLALEALEDLKIDTEFLKAAIERKGGNDRAPLFEGPLPDSEADRTRKLAIEIAIELGHGWIGTDHLLLALIRNTETISSRTFGELGITFEIAKAAVIRNIEKGNRKS